MPVTLIGEAVFARCLSALKDERVTASKVLTGPQHKTDTIDRKIFIEDVRRALYCSKVISYAQGYMLLREAGKEQGWNLNMGGIALMWRPRRSRPHWHFLTDIARRGYRRICCRRSATSLALTPMSGWTSRAANTSIQTGRDAEAGCLRALTMFRNQKMCWFGNDGREE